MLGLDKYFCRHSYYEKNRYYEKSLLEKGINRMTIDSNAYMLMKMMTGITTIILCCEKCGVYKIYREKGKLIYEND